MASKAPTSFQYKVLEQDVLTYSKNQLGWYEGKPFHCQGPWRYPTYNCYQEKSDPLCGAAQYAKEKHVVWGRCSHPDFGISGYSEPTMKRRIEIHTSVYEIQTHSSDGTLQGAHRYVMEKCQRDHGPGQLTSLPEGSRMVCHNVVLLTPRVRNNESLRWEVEMYAQLPQYHEQEDPRCGIDEGKSYETTNHNKVEAYTSCRHPSFGLTRTDECHQGQITHYGAAGLHSQELQGLVQDLEKKEIASFCMTCDGVPTEPAMAKFNCLLNNFQTVSELPGSENLEKSLAERMLLLDMLYAHQLSPSQRQKALELGCIHPEVKLRLQQRRQHDLPDL